MAEVEEAGTWRAVDIAIKFDDEQTDDPVVTVEISTPTGTVKAMAEPEDSADGRTLLLRRLHIHAINRGALQFGPGNLRKLADAVMEEFDYDETIIEGAARTTGATKDRRPVLRFKRRIFPSR